MTRVHVVIDSLTWGGAELLLGDLAAAAPDAGIELSVGYLSSQDGNVAADRLRRNGIEPQRPHPWLSLSTLAARRLRVVYRT